MTKSISQQNIHAQYDPLSFVREIRPTHTHTPVAPAKMEKFKFSWASDAILPPKNHAHTNRLCALYRSFSPSPVHAFVRVQYNFYCDLSRNSSSSSNCRSSGNSLQLASSTNNNTTTTHNNYTLVSLLLLAPNTLDTKLNTHKKKTVLVLFLFPCIKCTFCVCVSDMSHFPSPNHQKIIIIHRPSTHGVAHQKTRKPDAKSLSLFFCSVSSVHIGFNAKSGMHVLSMALFLFFFFVCVSSTSSRCWVCLCVSLWSALSYFVRFLRFSVFARTHTHTQALSYMHSTKLKLTLQAPSRMRTKKIGVFSLSFSLYLFRCNSFSLWYFFSSFSIRSLVSRRAVFCMVFLFFLFCSSFFLLSTLIQLSSRWFIVLFVPCGLGTLLFFPYSCMCQMYELQYNVITFERSSSLNQKLFAFLSRIFCFVSCVCQFQFPSPSSRAKKIVENSKKGKNNIRRSKKRKKNDAIILLTWFQRLRYQPF